jgi:hypothetical protein
MFAALKIREFLLSKHVIIKIYKSVILPVVQYGCKIWSLKLRKEYRLRVFENSVLRKTFEPSRDEIIRLWIKLHSEEFHNNSSPNIIRMIKSWRMTWA